MAGRRDFLIAGSAGIWMLTCWPYSSAQPQTKVHVIGILAPDSVETRRPLVEIFIRAMREYGYVEGRNVKYEPRYAGGDNARLAQLADELVQQKPDLIVVPNGLGVNAAAQAVAKAKRTTPIVFAGWANPSASNLVVSLARPGGHVTGLSNITIELIAKQLQMLKQVHPKAARLAVFMDSTTTGTADQNAETQRAAKTLGMQALLLEVRHAGDMEKTLASLRKWGADCVFVQNNPINFNNRKLLVQFAETTRLPAVYGNEVYTEIGGLLSYGSDDKTRWQQVARYVDKILKGVNPGELPIELPTKFDLVVNLKTAKALGITIPQSILVSADRLIE